ncbi:MAG TPA: hypothetical protein VL172_02455 [Kofleriaceae bacterium]|nr:hypothetical protein [Kofleriaceae bacterium]
MIARVALACLLLPLLAAPARAEPPPPPPYSIPWQLRPVAAANLLRCDTSTALYDSGDARGATVSSMLTAAYRLTPVLAPLLRLAVVYNDAPAVDGGPPDGAALVNPLLGVTLAGRRGALRWAASGAVTLPIGQGGGDDPDAGAAEATARGVPARSAMDNAMFATNYAAVIAGGGAAWVDRGVTAQAEVTLLQLQRVRGPDTLDERRTNLTAGVHLGWFAAPWLSLGGELRYQRWLSDAAPVRMNPDARETFTAAAGPRAHIRLRGGRWLRPGISYARALDAPFASSHYQMIQLDLPFAF